MPISRSLSSLAGAMVLAALIFLTTRTVAAYVGGTLLAFGSFVYYHRSRWQVFGRWGGTANALTALRGLGLIGLCFTIDSLHPYLVLMLGIFILVLDGLDGYYARRYHTTSDFGDAFDKEVDALFVLSFGVMIVDRRLAGSWVILPGLLRYAYVIGLTFLDPPPSPPKPSFRRRFVGMWLMGTLLAPFALPTAVYLPGLIFATAMVVGSFVTDFYRAVREQSAVKA